MNIFIALMLVFAAAGLLDEILGGKLGLMPNFEKGLATMGGLAMSTVGFYAIGVTYVQTHAEAIAEAAKHMPFDPALIPSCLLAPDMGALGMAQKLAATPALAAFTGAMVAGSLGMTVGYQLPVFLAAVRKDEIGELMRGFIFGLIAIPSGLAVGGLMLGLPVRQLFFNMIPVLVLCMVLIAAFVLVPALTMKIMIFLGNAIRIFSFLLFGVAVFGIFMPKYAVVENALIEEMLFMVLRMVIAACGGLVLSQVALKRLQKPIQRIGAVLGIKEEAVVGLFLSFIQSLAMLPLFSKMDKRGKVLNAAFSVAGRLCGRRSDDLRSIPDTGKLGNSLYDQQGAVRRTGGCPGGYLSEKVKNDSRVELDRKYSKESDIAIRMGR